MTTERRPSGTRPHIGGFPALSVNVLHLRGWRWSERHGDATRAGALEYRRLGVLVGKVNYRATIGPQSGQMSLECSFADEPHPTMEHVEITSVSNAWGGRHWFLVCPLTGRRARKLHRWPGLGFSHREASPVPPIYACQQDSGMARTGRTMHDIRKRVGGLPWEVEKPSGMRRRRFNHLCMRYAAMHDSFWAPTRALLARLD